MMHRHASGVIYDSVGLPVVCKQNIGLHINLIPRKAAIFKGFLKLELSLAC